MVQHLLDLLDLPKNAISIDCDQARTIEDRQKIKAKELAERVREDFTSKGARSLEDIKRNINLLKKDRKWNLGAGDYCLLALCRLCNGEHSTLHQSAIGSWHSHDSVLTTVFVALLCCLVCVLSVSAFRAGVLG
jgi:hypothetical protein